MASRLKRIGIVALTAAAVCVAGSCADIASLASCTGGVRTTGILVREQSEAAVDAEEYERASEFRDEIRKIEGNVSSEEESDGTE